MIRSKSFYKENKTMKIALKIDDQADQKKPRNHCKLGVILTPKPSSVFALLENKQEKPSRLPSVAESKRIKNKKKRAHEKKDVKNKKQQPKSKSRSRIDCPLDRLVCDEKADNELVCAAYTLCSTFTLFSLILFLERFNVKRTLIKEPIGEHWKGVHMTDTSPWCVYVCHKVKKERIIEE